MPEMLMAALLAAVEIICFFLIGGLIPLRTKTGSRSAAETVCAGFVLYLAALELFALLFTWNAASLTTFVCVWAGCTSVLLTLSFVFGLEHLMRNLRRAAAHPGIGAPELVVLLTAVVSSAYAALFPAAVRGSRTAANIIADIASDTLGLYPPGSAERLTAFVPAELLARFSAHGDYLTMLTGFDVETVICDAGVMVTVFLSVLAVYRALVRLLGEERMRAAMLTILFIGANLFFRMSGAEAFMLFESGWSGDSIFVNVMLPLLLVIAAACAQAEDARGAYALLFLFGIAACSLSRTAVLVCPFAMAAALTAAAVRARRPQILGHLLLALVIPAAALVLVLTVPFISIG